MQKQYINKQGSYISKSDAKIIGNFIEERFPEGIYTAKDVLIAARPKNSPIHKYFDWDDTTAAEKYRLFQARILITSYRVIINNVEAPSAVNVYIDDTRTYMATDVAQNVPSIWDAYLESALRDLKSWKHRYDSLSKLKPIIKHVDKFLIKTMKGNNNEKKGSRTRNKNSNDTTARV